MTGKQVATKLLFRPDEVADLLSCSKDTVHRLVAENELEPHSRKGGKKGLRITAKSVHEYVEKYKGVK